MFSQVQVKVKYKCRNNDRAKNSIGVQVYDMHPIALLLCSSYVKA